MALRLESSVWSTLGCAVHSSIPCGRPSSVHKAPLVGIGFWKTSESATAPSSQPRNSSVRCRSLPLPFRRRRPAPEPEQTASYAERLNAPIPEARIRTAERNDPTGDGHWLAERLVKHDSQQNRFAVCNQVGDLGEQYSFVPYSEQRYAPTLMAVQKLHETLAGHELPEDFSLYKQAPPSAPADLAPLKERTSKPAYVEGDSDSDSEIDEEGGR